MKRALLALIILLARPALAEPTAPPGVDLTKLLGAGSVTELQRAADGIKGDIPAARWARARLAERQAEVLAAAGLVGPAGDAASRGVQDCGSDPWAVAARLHLLLARCCDDLSPDRRAAYDRLRDCTWDGEIAAAEGVVKRLDAGANARLLGLQMEGERAYHACRARADANPDKLLAPVIARLRDLRGGLTDPEAQVTTDRALCAALNDLADATRRRGNALAEAGKPDQAAAQLQAAARLFGEADALYATLPHPLPTGQATLRQNRALALLNLGEVRLYSTPFDDPQLTDAARDALLRPVRQAAPPAEVTRPLQEALRLGGGSGEAGPAPCLRWVLLQNLAQAATYAVMVSPPADPAPSLRNAARLARRAGDELEHLGLYREALDARAQEARALELSGQMIEAVLVYLHATDLCAQAVAGLAPAEGGEYRRTRDALFGRLQAVLLWLRRQGQPFPDDLLGEGGASWDEMATQLADLARARTFADFVQMGAVWRESRVPLIAAAERLRRDQVRLEEQAARGALDETGQRELARLRARGLETAGALAAGAERGYAEAMGLTHASLAQVQSVMHDDEAIVAYSLWQGGGAVAVLRRSGKPAVTELSLGASAAAAGELLGREGRQELETVVAGLVAITRAGLWPEQTGVTAPEGGAQPLLGHWPEALRLLHEILIAPIAAQLAGAQTIIVVPQGALHYLPFEALIAGFPDGRAPAATAASLPADTRFWGLTGDVRAVAYLPTIASLVALRTRPQTPTAGVGMVLRPRYPQVDESDAYQQAVAKLGGLSDAVAEEPPARTLLEGAAATPAAARQLLAAPVKLAVFGCHGQANWRAPLDSCLRLAPSAGHEQDAAWREGEPLDVAQTMTLPVAAPVVFLAACQTGQATPVSGHEAGGMGRPGDDLLSLSRGVLIAGASTLVTSLWECDPAVTVDFWRAFARAWMRDGRTVGEAVLAAKREIIRRQAAVNPRAPYATPTWWAGFEVHGEPALRYADH